MTATGTATADLERVLTFIRHKTVRYGVEYPFHLPHPGRDVPRHHHTGDVALTRSLVAYEP
ncbi:hypothetical protein [Streptomyces decoyicus]|uniref:hypothetical protein n=1 Tax=Streptomyces decoyicus TaxID=249567 RepID=UPI0036493E94